MDVGLLVGKRVGEIEGEAEGLHALLGDTYGGRRGRHLENRMGARKVGIQLGDEDEVGAAEGIADGSRDGDGKVVGSEVGLGGVVRL
jgi:hypothetical protein